MCTVVISQEGECILSSIPQGLCLHAVTSLEEGWFKGQPQEVVPGGLGGIQSALERLKDGK